MVMAYMLDAENVHRWMPIRNFGDRQGDAIIYRDYDAPRLTDSQLRILANKYDKDIKYARINHSRFVRQHDPRLCGQCLFYRIDGDDIGTCTITDNIVEASQEACTDYRKE